MTEGFSMVGKLIEIIKEAVEIHGLPTSARLADHLLKNGVIAPPVKIDDVVYYIDNYRVKEAMIEEIRIDAFGQLVIIRDISTTIRRAYKFDRFGKIIFHTRKEAEKCLNLSLE